MIRLQNLIPTNLQEEKGKFLNDETYNPQFTYEQPIAAQSLTEQGLPQAKYLALAQAILDEAYAERTEEMLFESEGPKISQSEVTQKTKQFLQMHHLEHRYKIVWSSSFVSRTSVSTNAIKLRLPVDFRKEGLLGMLYHEIGTHALRRINYEHQPWFKKKKKYGFADYLRTEEGLAVLHSLIPHTVKLAFTAALRYQAVAVAQAGSFAEVWQFLKQYVDDQERRWTIAFRQKRGQTDTSQPGGFTKDLVYFEGMVDVWQYLKQHRFDSSKLYLGKLAHQDVLKAEAMNPSFKPLLPSFLAMHPDEYAKQLMLIGKSNFLEQL